MVERQLDVQKGQTKSWYSMGLVWFVFLYGIVSIKVLTVMKQLLGSCSGVLLFNLQ